MHRFEFLSKKHDVDLRLKPLYFDVSMTRWPGMPVKLSICSHLPSELAVIGTAIMFGVLEMDWPGQIFRFRFPLPEDRPAHKRGLHRQGRDYRLPRKWAEAYLIPDDVLASISHGAIDEHEWLQENCIPWDFYQVRAERWAHQQRGLVPFLFG